MKEKVRSGSILFLTIVVLLLTSSWLPADTSTCDGVMVTLPFTDVSGNIFFCQIAEAWFSGLTTGTTPTTYSPNDFVRRDQMAAFVTRMQDSALVAHRPIGRPPQKRTRKSGVIFETLSGVESGIQGHWEADERLSY